MVKNKKIICPTCGHEYHIAEIYYGDKLLGRPLNIIKDENGKILGFEGSDANYSEQYICDNCDSRFEVTASITYETKEVINLFDDEEEF